MSIWEVAMLTSRNRIALGKSLMPWIEDAVGRSGATFEPLSPDIAVESCHLPGGFRSDPADEIIVATARMTGAVLMTRDRRMLEYAATGNLTAVAA
jgi:PIN domain nuclease of toxin-antitoxin system